MRHSNSSPFFTILTQTIFQTVPHLFSQKICAVLIPVTEMNFPIPRQGTLSGRRAFTSNEDALLARIMADQPFLPWLQVASQIPGRSARQCRDRWVNYVCPHNKNAPWTQAEDAFLIAKVRDMGQHWAQIAKFFDGRSENNVKNRWYTYLKLKDRAEQEGIAEKTLWLAPVRKIPLPPISSFLPYGWDDPLCDVVATSE
jgi:hypothetical protein